MAWWNADPKDRLDEAQRFATGMRERQYRPARARAQAALFLYRGSSRLRLNGSETSYWGSDFDDTPPHNNVIATAIDWFVSTFLRNRIRPYFLTTKGNARDREKAQARQRATEGTMAQLGMYGELGALFCRDGFTFRGGGIEFAADYQGKRVTASRVRSWEFQVPEREARLGFPRQGAYSQCVPREVLLSMFEEGTDEYRAILEAKPEALDASDMIRDDHSEMILVNKLWHLPSGRVDLDNPAAFGLDEHHEPDEDAEPGHDGYHMMTIAGCELKAKPWPFNYFPIAWFKPFREPVGFWSQGIPEIGGGTHVALLEVADSKQRYLRRHAVPHLLVYDKARLSDYDLSNDDARIWKTRLPPSQSAMYLQTNAVPGELLQYEGQLIAWLKERLGVSDMNLFGEKPPGVDHAPGMEHLSEMTQVRQTAPYQAWERAYTDAATIINDCFYDLAQQVDDFRVIFGDNKELVDIPWDQMNMAREAYITSVFPTNYFAITPTAKFRQVKEMGQAGMFNGTPQSRLMLRAMDYPDVEALVGDQVSSEKNIETCLDNAAKGKPDEEWIPQPYMDLEVAKQRARDRINAMEADGENAESIDRVITFFELCDKLSMAAGPTPGPQTQTGPMPPPAPTAAPMTAPAGAPIQ